MNLSIIIPFYNGHRYLDKLLKSIPEQIPVIIIDDKSDEPLRPLHAVRVETMKRKGYFTGAVNEGIRQCDTDVLILNQDVYFNNTDWLNLLEDKSQHYDLIGEMAGTHPSWPDRYIHGTFMYISRKCINKTGLLDEVYFPLWGSTADYQARAARKGFKALPVENIPGFVHERRGNFGESIAKTLAQWPGMKGKLIRTPPLISVIITCYNYGRYLEDAVNSLIGGQTSLGEVPGQTFQGFEVVIVDDGSTDNTAQIGQALASNQKGIYFVQRENGGSAAAANTGIDAAHIRSGHCVAMLDADDMMKPDRLAHLLNAYETNQHSVIYDNIAYFAHGKLGTIEDVTNPKDVKKRLDLGPYDFERVLYKNMMHKGLLFQKAAWEEVGGYPEVMNQGREDWAFNVGLGIKGWCGVNTGFFDYLYRREGHNRTLQNTNPVMRAFFLGQLKKLYPRIYAGERPIMCCGNRRKTSGSSNTGARAARAPQPDLPGQDGLVILEYNGSNSGDETWRGPVTNKQYIFGGIRKRGYVFKDDAYGRPGTANTKAIDGMLLWKSDGRRLFTEIPAAKPEPKPEPELKIEIPQVVSYVSDEPMLEPTFFRELEDADTESPVNESMPDISTMTLSEVKTFVSGFVGNNVLMQLIADEKAGKNRITVLKVLESELD